MYVAHSGVPGAGENWSGAQKIVMEDAEDRQFLSQ